MNTICKIHGTPLICFCPVCRGSVKSKRKARAAKLNGLKGGRPRKKVKP